jgi:hypothetical protein
MVDAPYAIYKINKSYKRLKTIRKDFRVRSHHEIRSLPELGPLFLGTRVYEHSMPFRSHVVHLGNFLSPKMSLKSGCQKRDRSRQ